MQSRYFSIYEALLSGLDSQSPLVSALSGEQWCLAATESGTGIAMHTPGSSIAPMFSSGFQGLPLKAASAALMSWNMEEASFGLAAVNAFYNTPERLSVLRAALPEDGHYGDGMDFTGMTVGIVGHMRGPRGLREQAKAVYVLERSPKPGDYPDTACDYILPKCDLVIITGSSLINKSLPHLLELCRDAYTILTGPSVPLCPALLDFGIDRLAGLVVTEREAMARHVRDSVPGSPHHLGRPFLLSRQNPAGFKTII